MAHQQLVAQGRAIHIDPRTASVADFPDFQKLDPTKANAKLEEMRRGAEIIDHFEPLPRSRKCQDAGWALFFAVCTVGVAVALAVCMGSLADMAEQSKGTTVAPSSRKYDGMPSLTSLLFLFGIGGGVTIFCALLFMVFAERQPACLVWTSLIMGPALMIIFGMLLASVSPLPGLILMALGVVQLSYVFCCWQQYIPFTIQLVETIAGVIQEHPCMLTVGIVGSLFAALWVGLVFLAASALLVQSSVMSSSSSSDTNSDGGSIGLVGVFFFALLLYWGTQVAGNVCHVTYCGVFGRWYYGTSIDSSSDSDAGRTENLLTPSLRVALTTSLGSICFGSFLVAFIRALQAVASQMRRDTDNPVICIIGCLLECLLSCVGDAVEYFNDWAYVQCAIRGTSMCESAKVTYAMITCANVQYIINDCLLNSVVSFGTLVISCLSAGITAAVAWTMLGAQSAAFGGAFGFVTGLIAGAATVGVMNSGGKTLLACWADNPKPLMESHPVVHDAFMSKAHPAF